MLHECVNDPNSFCYICGAFTTKFQGHNWTLLVMKTYELNFQCHIGDQDKVWTPH